MWSSLLEKVRELLEGWRRQLISERQEPTPWTTNYYHCTPSCWWRRLHHLSQTSKYVSTDDANSLCSVKLICRYLTSKFMSLKINCSIIVILTDRWTSSGTLTNVLSTVSWSFFKEIHQSHFDVNTSHSALLSPYTSMAWLIKTVLVTPEYCSTRFTYAGDPEREGEKPFKYQRGVEIRCKWEEYKRGVAIRYIGGKKYSSQFAGQLIFF